MNQDAVVYGTFAEIGAGQEVVRWFFHVGGASGTVAKTISAYDMVVSDAIYGRTERYVSRKRLEAMLVYEYDLLRRAVGAAARGPDGVFRLCRYGGHPQPQPAMPTAMAGSAFDFKPCPGPSRRSSFCTSRRTIPRRPANERRSD